MKRIKIIFLSSILLLVTSATTFAGDDKDVALVLKTRGIVKLNKEGRKGWTQARRGERLDSGEVVQTSEKSLAALIFTDDKSQLKVRSNSRVTIKGKREEKGIIKRLALGFGEIWAKVTRQNTSMRVETPSGVATVKGTEFNALFDSDNFFIYCREGLMELSNQLGNLQLGANQMARMTRGTAPQRVTGNPDDIFSLSGDEETGQLRIDFEDDDGNQKSLIIDLEEN